MKTRQTANRDQPSLTYKPPSEPESSGPNVSRTGVQEVEVRLRVRQRVSSRRGRIPELLPSPEHRGLRSRPPKLGNLGERAPQLPLHLKLQSGSTPRQDLEILALERHGEEAQLERLVCGVKIIHFGNDLE